MNNIKTDKREPITLKPCPFCGSRKTRRESTEGIDGRLWWVTCETCGAATGLKPEAIEATAVLNLRVNKANRPRSV